METSINCIPCFIRQAIDGITMLTDDPEVHERLARDVLRELSILDYTVAPPKIGRMVHKMICRASGNSDPYHDIKKRCNRHALELYTDLKSTVNRASDLFGTAVRLAIAGNIIDFGTGTQVNKDTITGAIDAALIQPIDTREIERLKVAIENAETILYLGDNAGEIVFDRVLIEELPCEKIIFAVRGAPVINDVLMEDAVETGLTGLVRVIDNGSDVPGTDLSECSEKFKAVYKSADLVIAKGQGNFETLHDADKNIFFLFKVKCPVVAGHSGQRLGDAVITATG